MKCMVTGATGFIGSRLIEALLSQGHQVNVLVRIPEKLPGRLLEKIKVFKGDVLDTDAIRESMDECQIVFHLAAYANLWSRDQRLPYQINVAGTKNVLNTCLEKNIQKVIFTSSAGTLASSDAKKPIDEDSPLPELYQTDYDMSKRQAEELCKDYQKMGLNIVVLNPTRVFGPGPLNKSNSMTILVKKYLQGKWRFIPGNGKAIGNYVFIDDVVQGHLLAMQSGITGENYILGGSNTSLLEFFNILSEVSGKQYQMIHLPFFLIKIFAEVQLFMAEHFGKDPAITPSWVRRYKQHRLVSSKKAIETLGYTITPLPVALGKTLEWLRST